MKTDAQLFGPKSIEEILDGYDRIGPSPVFRCEHDPRTQRVYLGDLEANEMSKLQSPLREAQNLEYISSFLRAVD